MTGRPYNGFSESSQAWPIYRGKPGTGQRSCASGTCQRAPIGCHMTHQRPLLTRKQPQNAVGPQCNLKRCRIVGCFLWMFFFKSFFFDWDLEVNGFCEILDSRLLKGNSFLDSQFNLFAKATGCVFPNWPVDFDWFWWDFFLGNSSLFHGHAGPVLSSAAFRVSGVKRTFAGFLPKHSTVNPQWRPMGWKGIDVLIGEQLFFFYL